MYDPHLSLEHGCPILTFLRPSQMGRWPHVWLSPFISMRVLSTAKHCAWNYHSSEQRHARTATCSRRTEGSGNPHSIYGYIELNIDCNPIRVNNASIQCGPQTLCLDSKWGKKMSIAVNQMTSIS